MIEKISLFYILRYSAGLENVQLIIISMDVIAVHI